MKHIKYLTVSIFILALFTPAVIFAYTGQYTWDPIYFEVEDTQETKNSKTEQRLKSQYGLSAFYNCYPCINKDTSNPYTETNCLLQTEYCLERQELKKETECSSGYVYFNERCVTIDQGCKEQYGQGSYYRGVTDENGKYSCDCETGYKWNDAVPTSPFRRCVEDKITSCSDGYVLSGNACITYTQNCQNKYGLNSYGDKQYCYCLVGYEWNSNKTTCTKKETTVSPKIKGVDHLLFPESILISEGALIRATNGIDIYIVKYVGSKRFKRLILSPSVFNNYGHLKWEDVMDVSQAILDSFTTSELVRVIGDDKIYRLYPQGDKGQKRLIKNNSVLTRLGLDPDSIYEINSFDRESYARGLDLE